MAVVGPIYSLKHHLRAGIVTSAFFIYFYLCSVFNLWWPLLRFPVNNPGLGEGLSLGMLIYNYTPSFNAYRPCGSFLFWLFPYWPWLTWLPGRKNKKKSNEVRTRMKKKRRKNWIPHKLCAAPRRIFCSTWYIFHLIVNISNPSCFTRNGRSLKSKSIVTNPWPSIHIHNHYHPWGRARDVVCRSCNKTLNSSQWLIILTREQRQLGNSAVVRIVYTDQLTDWLTETRL